MDGVEKIIQKIKDDAVKKADEIVYAANKEAATIIKEAKAQGATNYSKVIKNAEVEAQLLKQRMESEAIMNGKKKTLNTKKDIIEEIFNKALLHLGSLKTEEYTNILLDMILENVSTGCEQIIFNANDSQLIGENIVKRVNIALEGKGLKGKITISDKQMDMVGGFILVDDKIETNCTFEVIINSLKRDLEYEIIDMVFNQQKD